MTGWADAAQVAILDEQDKLIEQKYGKDAAASANYGWGVSCDRDFISVATKVYLATGAKVLVSNLTKGGTTAHEWEDYHG